MGRMLLLTSGVITAVVLGPAAAMATSGVAIAQPISVDAPLNQSSECDSNYSGCVPVASDVDCEGGSGNGPEYVAGPISVIGNDIYDLDRDGNGTACES